MSEGQRPFLQHHLPTAVGQLERKHKPPPALQCLGLSCCHSVCIKPMHVLRQKKPSRVYFNTSQVKPCGNAFKLLCCCSRNLQERLGAVFLPNLPALCTCMVKSCCEAQRLWMCLKHPSELTPIFKATTRPGSAAAVDQNSKIQQNRTEQKR